MLSASVRGAKAQAKTQATAAGLNETIAEVYKYIL